MSNFSSNLPPAARKQAKEAARIQAEAAVAHKNGGAPPVAAPAQPAPGASAAPASLQPVTQFVPGNDQPPQGFTPAQPPAAAAPPQPPAAPPANATDPAQRPAAPAPSSDDFKQRYRVLQGKYNNDVVSLRTEVQVLRDQLAQANARSSAPVAPTAQPVAPARAASVVTPEEAQEYGPELIALVERIAGATLQPALQQVQNEVQRATAAARTSADHLAAESRNRVYEALNAFDPDWELVNHSDEFVAWLNQFDVISGSTRRAGLMNAFEKNDAARVVSIFRLFKEEDSRSRSTAPRIPTVDPATLIAPGPAGGSAPAAPSATAGKIWSEEEIGVFNAQVRRGKIKGDERSRIEAEIMQALREGRVRPTINTANLANAAH